MCLFNAEKIDGEIIAYKACVKAGDKKYRPFFERTRLPDFNNINIGDDVTGIVDKFKIRNIPQNKFQVGKINKAKRVVFGQKDFGFHAFASLKCVKIFFEREYDFCGYVIIKVRLFKDLYKGKFVILSGGGQVVVLVNSYRGKRMEILEEISLDALEDV